MNKSNQLPLSFVSSWEQLQGILNEHRPILYVGSQTSTVIPYGTLNGNCKETQLVSLSSLPKKIFWDEGHEGSKSNTFVCVEGPVSWEELRTFCRSFQRDLPV